MIRTVAAIEAEIKAKRAEQDRLPSHWLERREVLAGQLEVLVLERLAL